MCTVFERFLVFLVALPFGAFLPVPLMALDSYGVFPVLAPSGGTIGTAWLMDEQEGLLLTAAHVAVDAGADHSGGEVKLVAKSISHAFDPPRRAEGILVCEVVCLGVQFDDTSSAGPGSDLRRWREDVRGNPSTDDWALLRVVNMSLPDQTAILGYFSAIPIDPFATASELDRLSKEQGAESFIVLGKKDNAPDLRTLRGQLVARDAPPGLWTLTTELWGGYSGAPVMFDSPTGRKACALAINRDTSIPKHSVVLGLHAIRDDMAKKVTIGRRVSEIVDLYSNSSPPDHFVAETAMKKLLFYEHRQLVSLVCSTPPAQALWTMLRDYYRAHRDTGFIESLIRCNNDVSLRIVEEATSVASGSGVDAPDELDQQLALSVLAETMAFPPSLDGFSIQQARLLKSITTMLVEPDVPPETELAFLTDKGWSEITVALNSNSTFVDAYRFQLQAADYALFTGNTADFRREYSDLSSLLHQRVQAEAMAIEALRPSMFSPRSIAHPAPSGRGRIAAIVVLATVLLALGYSGHLRRRARN